MELLQRVYAAAARAATAVLPLASPFNAKLAHGIAARQRAVRHLQDWARTARDPARPLVWLHAPSVGEALMAQAIAEALRALAPDAQLALTIFSPSAERVLDRMPVDVAGYLPWDTPAQAAATLAALQPAAVGFVRTEVWPLMLDAACASGARVALVNAVLAPSSSRLRWPARALLERLYARLDAVGVTSAAHAERFASLGVPAERVRVTGDGRFDQVIRRVAAVDRSSPLLRALGAAPQPLLVAGSTWPLDERVLVNALATRVRAGQLRLVIAPHEPTDAHVAALETMLDTARLPHQRVRALQDGGAARAASVLIVDRMGLLADLYAVAHHAYVGGGFGSTGLHSVVEPAAHGVPTLFGPRHGNATEAAELDAEGGGAIVGSAGALASRSAQWSDDPAAYAHAADAARAFVTARSGGGERNARLLLELAGITAR
jgi:3-deoxy-D-manno-octulosonic-acid transferase